LKNRPLLQTLYPEVFCFTRLALRPLLKNHVLIEYSTLMYNTTEELQKKKPPDFSDGFLREGID
jgi:hypothetical protein